MLSWFWVHNKYISRG